MAIEGLDELNKQIDALKGIKTSKALVAGAYTLQGYAQSSDDMPVKTGFLRASAESVETDLGAELRFDADYAIYQELGTENIPARLFVTNAIDEHEGDILNAIIDVLNKQIEEAVK